MMNNYTRILTAFLLSVATVFPSVAQAAPLTPAYLPNDPLLAQQWYLNTLNVPRAWDTARTSDIIVAVLDTGVDATHPELAGRVLPGYNTYDNSTDTTDSRGHGTWVAGTIAGAQDNGAGISGVGGNIKILPIKVTDPNGIGYNTSVAEGLTRARTMGAKIANISFEVHGGDEVITEAARKFYEHGGLVFAASGNDRGRYAISNNPYIISVASTNHLNNVSAFSSQGPFVDLAAPGEGILTTGLGGTHVRVTGTSFASPIAAATAALVWAANPSLSQADVELALQTTARDIGDAGKDERSGHGLIDAAAAVGFATAKGVVHAAAPSPVLPPADPYMPYPYLTIIEPVETPVVTPPPKPVAKKVVYKRKIIRYTSVRRRVIRNNRWAYVWIRVPVYGYVRA